MDWTDISCAVLMASIAISCTIGITLSIMDNADHERMLKQNGCQLIHQSDTGRYHWVGKIREHEQVFVYECAGNVTRTEVH